jgi:hypothetical protein
MYMDRVVVATPPEKAPPRLKRTAVVLGLLFLFDLGFSGQGLYSLLVAAIGFAILSLGGAWSLIRGRQPLARSRAARAALYLLLAAATIGALRFHAYTARVNTERVIAACRAYERANGRLPERLQDLVPAFLPAVPRAKYVLMFGEFNYFSSPESHTLQYVALAPFGRRLYHFEQDRWSSLD